MTNLVQNNPPPLVSICCITYNHAGFIKEALDSFLMQTTSFPIEIIVHDDCSTDGTADIVKEYQGMYPDLIKPIFQTENQWSKGKKIYLLTFEKARGKYIATCEGDDYWIDPGKLQKQVDFLERYPEYSMCAHNTKIIHDQDAMNEHLFRSPGGKPFLGYSDILEELSFHFSSVMIRNGIITVYPEWYYKLPGGDWSLCILAAQYGNIGIIDEVMSVYRKHPGGIWTSRSMVDRYEGISFHFKLMFENLDPKYHAKLLSALSNNIKKAGEEFAEQELIKFLTISDLHNAASNFIIALLSDLTLNKIKKTKLKRRFYSGYFGALGYYFYKEVNLSSALKYLLKAIYNDPSWLKNKGFWSIIRQYILGPKLTNILKKNY